MQTLTEMVAAVVLHSSAAAYSHFGVTLDAQHPADKAAPAPAERTVARLPAPKKTVHALERMRNASDCPQAKIHLVKT